MDRQTLIDSIETIYADLESLSQFTSLICDFIKQPVSKKQVQDFSEKYILNVFVDPCELGMFYAKLTIERSEYNGELLRKLITQGTGIKSKELPTNLSNRMKALLNGTYDVLRETEVKLKELDYPDTAERIIALRRAACKIKLIFNDSRQLPINVDQFSTLELCSTDEIYLYKDLNECINSVNECLCYQFECFSNWTVLSTGYEGDFTDSIINCNNWISLRNFILYLDSFLEY